MSAVSNITSYFHNLLKTRWKYLFGLVVVVLIATIFFFQFNPIPKKLIILLVCLSAIPIVFVKEKLETSALCCILVLGTVFTFITPVLDTPDEPSHLARAFYVAEGNLGMSDKVEKLKISKDYQAMNERVKQTFKNDLGSVKTSSEKQAQVYITTTSTYSFIGYIPQALGLIVGKVLSLGLYWTFYLGRIFNLMIYALLAYLAIKKVKYYKPMFTTIAVFPMSIYLAASYSQDALANGLILLTCSYLVNLLFATEKIEHKELFTFFILCLIMISCKLPYVILSGILIFIEPKKYKDKKTYFMALALLGVLIVATLSWYLYYSTIQPVHRGAQVNPSEQLRFIKENLVISTRVLITALVDSINLFQMNFRFGWLKYFSAHVGLLYLAYFGGMCLFFPFNVKKKLSSFNKLGLSLIIVGVMLMIILSQYLTWTPVGELTVIGVQGRYFIGLFVLIPVLTNVSNLFYKQNVETEQILIDEVVIEKRKEEKKLNVEKNLWLISISTYFVISMIIFTIAFYSI
ncbi:hypothetical protein IGJ55_000837 [Enterococcus sp. AZ170]